MRLWMAFQSVLSSLYFLNNLNSWFCMGTLRAKIEHINGTNQNIKNRLKNKTVSGGLQ